MTNLESFITYKDSCPCCKGKLNLSFIFKSKTKIQYIEDRIVCDALISGFAMSKKSYRYTAKFYIDPKTNDFNVDFLDKNNQPYDRLMMSVIEKYYSFLKTNYAGLKFYKECTVCRKYNYSSNKIQVNHKDCKLEGFDIATEYFCLGKPIGKDIQVYKFLNNYAANQATIMIGKTSSFEFERMGAFNASEAILPGFVETDNSINLSKIESIDKLIDKLNLFYTLS